MVNMHHIAKAAEILATHPGPIHQRLSQAGSEFITEQNVVSLPPDQQREFAVIRKGLMADGRIDYTMTSISQADAVNLARRIFQFARVVVIDHPMSVAGH